MRRLLHRGRKKRFNEILKFNGIPIDRNNCNAKQQILWDAYYEIYVGVREREKANNDTYTIQCNIVFIECEKEAYQLVYEKYAGRISPKYERETFEMKEYFTNLYERIINFGRKLD